jgi:hypothetical protein
MEAWHEQAAGRSDGRLLIVVPRLDDGRIILLRRDEPKDGPDAFGLWALPACPLPGRGDHAASAFALLHTTTDYVPGRLAQLGAVHGPAPGGTAIAHCYLAEDLRPSPLPPNHAGRAMTTALPLGEIRQMMECGLIRCGTLLSALTLLDATIA